MQHWLMKPWVLGIVLGITLLAGALALSRGGFPGVAEAAGRGSWPSWTNPGTKIVPIVSAGTPGVRLGLAQVTGPKSRVKLVRAVLQIDGDFNSVRAKILVPSDSMTSLSRVQGTAVTAVAQYRLISFSSGGDDRSRRDDRPDYRYRRPYERQDDRPEYYPRHDNGKHKGWYKHGGKHARERE